MILLWGIPADPPLAAVRHALQRRGAAIAILDQRAVLDTEVELSVDATISGTLRVADAQLDLGDVSAVYLRPYEWRQLPVVERAGPGSVEWNHALSIQDTLASWVEITPALVVNRPTPMAANASKPYQTVQIRSLGFAVPDTLITTDPQAALEFWARHGTVIYKSVSGTRSIVSRLTAEHMDRLGMIAWCPTQFQEYIPGRDYRVHVVGAEIFACEIVSSSDDYRYAGEQGARTEIFPCDLSADCAAQCRALAASLQLPLAGIDLRRTPDGHWYCFEVNTCPGFTYFQQATNQPIDEAIARLLLAGSIARRNQEF